MKKMLLFIFVSLVLVSYATAQNFHWLSKYPALIKVVKESPGSTLTTSYTPVKFWHGKPKIEVHVTNNRSLVLKMEMPRAALFTIDPNTGRRIPAKQKPIFIARDHNLDGLPDDYYIKNAGSPPDNVKYTSDGFIELDNKQDNEAILIPWSSGIEIAIKRLIY